MTSVLAYAGYADDDPAIGALGWINTTSAQGVPDGSFAYAGYLYGSWTSHLLRLLQFGFAVPSIATIDGIQVLALANQPSGRSYSYEWSGRLYKAMALAGADRSAGRLIPVGSSDWLSYGGPSDLWGTTWTPADVNNVFFGFGFAAQGAIGARASIDSCLLYVYYHMYVTKYVTIGKVSGTSVTKTLTKRKLKTLAKPTEVDTSETITPSFGRHHIFVTIGTVHETSTVESVSAAHSHAITTVHGHPIIRPFFFVSPYSPIYEYELPYSFADRLYDLLAPYARIDETRHLRVFCDAFGEMFREVEELTSDRDDGLPGYANLLDVDRTRSDRLAYLAQFVGVRLLRGLAEEEQRELIRQVPGKLGRPTSIREAVKRTLIGTRVCILLERYSGSAWRWKVMTRTSETPDEEMTRAAIYSQKPTYDLVEFEIRETITYEWLKLNYETYQAIKDDNATYNDIYTKELVEPG